MASLVECLDALERIAPPSEGAFDTSASAETPRPSLDDSATSQGFGDGPCASAETSKPSLEDVPQPAMPQDFGAYELLAEIGSGGMGVVYKARQKGLERLVAIKMILASHLASPDQVRRFQEEARAAAGLKHPHIVHIHEVGQCHGRHYFAMEYIEGMSLAERLARGPLKPEEAARLVLHVARAVEHLHRHGYIHRDLKPSNILLDAEGEPYVTDFGLAKAFAPGSQATTTGVIAGTPSYMSPEQAAGHNAEVSRSSDIYSLGAILYEAMTGRPPFRAESPLDTLLAVLGGEPEASPPVESAPSARVGVDLLKVFVSISPGPVRDGGRAGRRPRPFPERRGARGFGRRTSSSGSGDGPGGSRHLHAAGGPGCVLCSGMGELLDRDHRLAVSWEDDDLDCPLDRQCDRLPTMGQGAARLGSRPIRLGRHRLRFVREHPLGGRRGGKPLDRRLFALDRRLRAVVPRAVRLVHDRPLDALLRER